MKDGYESFLAGKARRAVPCGFEPRGLNPALFGFQRDVVRWACRKGLSLIHIEMCIRDRAISISPGPPSLLNWFFPLNSFKITVLWVVNTIW